MTQAIEKLDLILDAERSILLRGALDQLPDLLAQKQAAIDGFSKHSDQIPDQIRQKLERNQSLLLAATGGLRAARKRLQEFRHVRDCLSYYDPTGQRCDARVDGARQLRKKT